MQKPMKFIFQNLFHKTMKMASIFVTHGGGPKPLYEKQQHKLLYQHFKEISFRYPNPKGIILFSAHWQQKQWTILDYDHPPLYYDYYGFPPQTYNLNYPIYSTLQLRNEIKQSLIKEGIKLISNTKRGYDHGTFIPLILMYPKANIPVIQISILRSMNPQAHFKMGVALRNLKKQGYLIMGSGSSVHGAFRQKAAVQCSRIFDNQLTQMCIDSEYNTDKLLQKVKNWSKLSYAKYLHPREQHLVPLFINLGAYQGKYSHNTKVFLMGVNLSNYVLQ